MRYDPTDTSDGMVPPAPEGRPNEFYVAAWRRTLDFKGVASRTEFWSFVLINAAIFWACAFLFVGWLTDSTASLALILCWAGLLIPSLSVFIRRVRDATGSGWFTLVPAAGLGATFFPARDRQRLDQLGNGYRDVWHKSADYLGVSNRSEFWTFEAINLALLIGGAVVAFFVSIIATSAPRVVEQAIFILVWGPLIVFFVALYVPSMPLAVRRVRSATGSGWWLLIGLIPWIGWLILLVFFLIPGPGSARRRPSVNRSTPGDDRPRWFSDDRQRVHRARARTDGDRPRPQPPHNQPSDDRPRWFSDDGPANRSGLPPLKAVISAPTGAGRNRYVHP